MSRAEPPTAADEAIASEIPPAKSLTVLNKSDLPAVWSRDDAIEVSAESGAGLDLLRTRLAGALDVEPRLDRPAVTNLRHITLVERAHDSVRSAAEAAASQLSEEFVLADLQSARAALEEITGRRTPDDVLAHIFARFCIGT
jgi:tRNA modification GTPase